MHRLKTTWTHLDALLRGEPTADPALRQGRLALEGRLLAVAALVVGVAYGLCVGSYALIRQPDRLDGWGQLLASAVKFPMLFALTLLVTLPSLYVFSAIAGSRLRFESVIKLLIAMSAVALTVLASLGPILVFFGLSTTSYAFMVLLNVVAATAGGVIGLTFLQRTLRRLIPSEAPQAEPAEVAEIEQESTQDTPDHADPIDAPDAPPGEPDASTPPPSAAKHFADRAAERSASQGPLARDQSPTDARAKSVFNTWTVLFAVVGAQMSWVLRPFIGHPDLPFTFFRERGDSNFFQAVMGALASLLGLK